jgi:hypothetical protein
MGIYVVLAGLALSIALLSFGNSAIRYNDAIASRQSASIMQAGLDQTASSIVDTLTAAAAATGGQITSVPAPGAGDGTDSVCALVGSAYAAANTARVGDASSAPTQNCATVTRRIAYAPLVAASSANAAVAPNVNVASTTLPAPGGGYLPVQQDIYATVTIGVPASASQQAASRSAVGHFTVVAICSSADNCGRGIYVPHVALVGWRDVAATSVAAANAGTSGDCGTGQGDCATSGADVTQGATQAQDDTRVHAQNGCYDPTYVGHGGPNAGDLCNPTQAVPGSVVGADAYATKTVGAPGP